VWTLSLRGGWSGYPGPHVTGHEILGYCEEQPPSRAIIFWIIYERNYICSWRTDLRNGETMGSCPCAQRKLIHWDCERSASAWDLVQSPQGIDGVSSITVIVSVRELNCHTLYSPRWEFILSSYGLWHRVVCSFGRLLTTYKTTEVTIWFVVYIFGIWTSVSEMISQYLTEKKRRLVTLDLFNYIFSIAYILSCI
jgi:hypothetical protein